jgi:hypothetical protein
MSEDPLKPLGYFLTSLSFLGLSIQLYITQKYQESITCISKNIHKNPSTWPPTHPSDLTSSQASWLKFFFGATEFIYLNGSIESRKASTTTDPLFGYSINCASLLRKVEKLQWFRNNSGKFELKWSENYIDSANFPLSKRNNVWVLTYDYFFPKRYCSVNEFKVRIKDVRKSLKFEQVFFCKAGLVGDVPKSNLDTDCLRVTKLASKTLDVIFRKDRREFSVDENGRLFISTLDRGNYLVTFWAAKFGQRISLIGKYDQDRVRPFCEVFSSQGDLSSEDLISQISTGPDKKIFLGLLVSLFIGVRLINK